MANQPGGVAHPDDDSIPVTLDDGYVIPLGSPSTAARATLQAFNEALKSAPAARSRPAASPFIHLADTLTDDEMAHPQDRP